MIKTYDEHCQIIYADEAALVEIHDLIDAILNVEVSGPVMTPDEFRAWLFSNKEPS